ncbi:MAG: hypothetical protein M5U22_20150 [Thermoleophilia bacterium]|nr:hypothetical protein [Thermoleophilia bacterium]
MSQDRQKIATLVRHWIEHNEGHRLSYLEWRDKLAEEELPATLAALERVAELTEQANAALREAAAELGASVPESHHPGHDEGHDYGHAHDRH